MVGHSLPLEVGEPQREGTEGGLRLPVRVTGVQDTVWDVNTGSGWLQGQRCRAASVRCTGHPLSAHPRLWPPYLDVKAAVLRDLK